MKIRWYWPETGYNDGLYREIVRKVEGVGLASYEKAGELQGVAEGLLAPHHANNAKRRQKQGRPPSTIEVERSPSGVDAYVVLKDSTGRAGLIENETGVLRKTGGVAGGK